MSFLQKKNNNKHSNLIIKSVEHDFKYNEYRKDLINFLYLMGDFESLLEIAQKGIDLNLFPIEALIKINYLLKILNIDSELFKKINQFLKGKKIFLA